MSIGISCSVVVQFFRLEVINYYASIEDSNSINSDDVQEHDNIILKTTDRNDT